MPTSYPLRNSAKPLLMQPKEGWIVRVLSNSVGTNDLPLITQGRQDRITGSFWKAESGLYEMKKDNSGDFTTLHTKGSVFDGEVFHCWLPQPGSQEFQTEQ